MSGKSDFERQVERDERAQTEDEGSVEFSQDAPEAKEIIARIKELVKKGNVTKIVVKRGDNTLVNIPLNVGIMGGILGIAAAPWAVIAAAVATAGFACQVEIVQDDGEVVSITGKAIADKARDVSAAVADAGNAAINGLKDAVESIRAEVMDADFEVSDEQGPDIEVEIEEDFQFDAGDGPNDGTEA